MQKTILVIDDSSSLRLAVRGALEAAGYAVLEAADGLEALARLDAGRVHLMICDVHMPNMDGLQFLRAVKQRADARFTPIIMLTTDGDESRKTEGQLAGARAWVIKPFQADALLRAVAKLIG
jgi:two-component system chemotaxis response regulator CheY